jgi:ATP-dependent Clp protease adapter protein ClpS
VFNKFMPVLIDTNRDVVIQAKRKPADKSKSERPKQYAVIMHQKNTGPVITCTACVLQKVFNKSQTEAFRHAEIVAERGAEPVFVSTQEVVETKTDLANAEKAARGSQCAFKLRRVHFTSEPL